MLGSASHRHTYILPQMFGGGVDTRAETVLEPETMILTAVYRSDSNTLYRNGVCTPRSGFPTAQSVSLPPRRE